MRYPKRWQIGVLVILFLSIAWFIWNRFVRQRAGDTQPASVPVTMQEGTTPSARADDSQANSTGTLTTGERSPDKPTRSIDDLVRMAETALQQFESSVDDYSAVIVKRERVAGNLMPEVTMRAKIRNHREVAGASSRPMQVYLRFESPENMKGREVIWTEGPNRGKMVAHEAGLLNVMNLYLDPAGPIAMLGSRYPITEIGLGKLLSKLIERGENERALGDCEINILSEHPVGDRMCELIQLRHPLKKPGVDFHIAEICFDHGRNIPLRYAAYSWPTEAGQAPQLEEEYTYLNVELNVGFSDTEFDIANPDYQFPK